MRTVVAILLALNLALVVLLIARASGDDGSNLINGGLNDIGWVTGILVGFVSIILLPLATGRTIGKMLTGIRVVSSDGTEPSVIKMLVRQVLAVVLFFVTLGISFLFAAFGSRGRALHDLLAGTQVIYAEKRSK